MKKEIKLMLTLVLAIAFVSCSKKPKTPTSKLQDEKYEVVVFNTAEDINKFLLEGLGPYTTKITDWYKYSQSTKSSIPVQVLTFYGYDSMTSEGDMKGIFGPEAARIIGIAPGAYIVARECYNKTFKLPKGQYIISYAVDHSKCGFMPTATSQKNHKGIQCSTG